LRWKAQPELALFTGLAFIECASNSIPFIATLNFLETMHHVEFFALVLRFVQFESIKQLQASSKANMK
jgi:hypothetical protein